MPPSEVEYTAIESNVKERAGSMRTIKFVVVLGATLLPAACGGGPEPPPMKAVADVKQLMNAMIDPAADELWEKSGYIITAAGIQERRPQNDEEWEQARHHAITITESANLLMIAPRAKDGDVWMKQAQELMDQGQAIWRAADAKDVDKLFTVGGDLYESCVHCHEKYIDAIVNANK